MLKNIGAILGCARNLTYARRHILQTSTGLFSTVSPEKIRNQNDMKFLPKKDLEDYMSYLPKFIEDVTSKEVMLGFQPVNERLRKVLEYMGPAGKHLRQHVVIYTYKAIEEHYQTFVPEKMEDVYKMCWCLELFNTELAILDDFLDEHEMRRNKPTWWKKEGKLAVMDMMLITASLPGILRKYFEQHPNYHDILKLFFTPEVIVSLSLELETRDYVDFTMKRCEEIALMKTVGYSTDLPFKSATLLANKGSYMNEYASKALRYTGLLYSIQNDILDVYGEDITGKACSDIKDKSCSYLIAMALAKASDNQKKILLEYYGSKDQKKIDKVKEIYGELDLLGDYYKMEEQYLEKTCEEIRKIPDEFARSLIEKLAYVQSYGQIGVPPY